MFFYIIIPLTRTALTDYFGVKMVTILTYLYRLKRSERTKVSTLSPRVACHASSANRKLHVSYERLNFKQRTFDISLILPKIISSTPCLKVMKST